MTIIHHNDLDGRLAAAIIYNKYKSNTLTKEIKCIEMIYSDKFDFSLVNENEEVWIVDFSLSLEDMKKLMDITKDIIWIDHHKTAVEKLISISENINGIREIGKSGSLLTFKWIYGDAIQVPWVVKYIDDYDIWKWEYKNTEYFKIGMESRIHNPTSFLWKLLFDDKSCELVNRINDDGKIVKKYIDRTNKEYALDFSYMTRFEDYNAIVINRGRGSSIIFKDIQSLDHDIMIAWVYNGKTYLVSLYTTKDNIDVSLIAKKYGGGGHKQAAGFSIENLPF